LNKKTQQQNKILFNRILGSSKDILLHYLMKS